MYGVKYVRTYAAVTQTDRLTRIYVKYEKLAIDFDTYSTRLVAHDVRSYQC